jgi:hypothetical protein
MNNTEKGAVGGGVIGAGAGTVIGAATGRPGLGAVLGTATGAVVGGAVGNQVDKDEARQKDIAQAAALADAQYQQQRLGIADVIAMAQAKQNDTIIINQIRNTRSTFNLTVSDLEMLKNNGVSDAVIAEMQAARAPAGPGRVVVREPRTVIYDSPPPAVIVRPAPYYYAPRPVYVVGGGYYRCR